MIFAFITSAILYRTKIKLHTREIGALPKYFHFKSNGNYSIEINPNSQSNFPITYDYYICTKKEFLSFISTKEKSICSISSNVRINTSTRIGKSSGVIKESGAYQFLFYPSSNDEKAVITVLLRNPNSYLDSQMEPCIYSEPIFTGIIFIILVIWIINWFLNICHNGTQVQFSFTLHEFITITYIVSLLYSICQTLELWSLHRKDSTTPLTEISITLRFLQYWVLFATMLMASKGWCIVHESISLFNVFLCILAANLLSIPLIIMEYVNLGNWVYLVLFIGIFCILFYYRVMVKSILDATLYVVAHLNVIANEGIDPRTTPIYTKYRMFRVISWGVVSYFLLTFLVSSIATFLDIPYCVEDVMQDVITLTLLGGAAYIFRLRKEMRKGYMMIGDIDESAEPQTFSREDVKEMTVRKNNGVENEGNNETKDNDRTMREWEEGMLLPPQPLLIDNDNDTQKEKKNARVKANEKDEREEELIKDGSVDV